MHGFVLSIRTLLDLSVSTVLVFVVKVFVVKSDLAQLIDHQWKH